MWGYLFILFFFSLSPCVLTLVESVCMPAYMFAYFFNCFILSETISKTCLFTASFQGTTHFMQ